jgi:myo-inositol-1(or 4)-monophosphatase
MNPVDAASSIAREAGALLLTFTAETKNVRKKGAVNLVTEADIASQELIVSRLKETFPSHSVLAEEESLDQSAGAEYLWIIDPLDGTTNYSHAYPVFGVSIALSVKGHMTAGVVFNPNSGELFAAERGRGATLNGSPIHVSNTTEVDEALLVTGVPYWIREKPEGVMAKFKAFSVRAQGVRRSGAASLDMCEVACGRVDGFWEEGLAPWDTAAGSLIIEEAGGRLTNLGGGIFNIFEPEVVASNGSLHMEMLEILKHAPYS